MKTLKKAWLTEQGNEIYSLTLESASLEQHQMLSTASMVFPAAEPTRHTTSIGLLGIDDLIMIADQIYREVDRLNETYEH